MVNLDLLAKMCSEYSELVAKTQNKSLLDNIKAKYRIQASLADSVPSLLTEIAELRNDLKEMYGVTKNVHSR